MNEARNGVTDLADLVRASRLPGVAERKRIRKAADVSLQQMADALGVTAPTVHHWENDRYGPSKANAAKYRKLLNELAKAAGTEIAEAS